MPRPLEPALILTAGRLNRPPAQRLIQPGTLGVVHPIQVRSEIVDLSLHILPLGTPQALGDLLQVSDYPGTTTPLQMLEKRADPAARCLLIPGEQFVRQNLKALMFAAVSGCRVRLDAGRWKPIMTLMILNMNRVQAVRSFMRSVTRPIPQHTRLTP